MKNSTKLQCPSCEKFFSVYGFNQHLRTHELEDQEKYFTISKRNSKELQWYTILNNEYTCTICNKKTSNKKSILSHYWYNHTEDGIQCRKNKNIGRIAWNRGLTKETNDVIARYAKKLSQINQGKPGCIHTEKTKKIIQFHAYKNKLGGHTSKHRVSYEKNGKIINLHSSYEYIVAKSLDSNNIEWTRPPYFWWYDVNDIKHRYYPDFYLPEYDIYLDPKNPYLISKDAEKITRVCIQNNIRILVLSKYELNWETIQSRIG